MLAGVREPEVLTSAHSVLTLVESTCWMVHRAVLVMWMFYDYASN